MPETQQPGDQVASTHDAKGPEELLRNEIGQRSRAVNDAIRRFEDDQGGAPHIGGWKRPRSR